MKFKRTKNAAVLGCGPAGLFATHALVENGWNVNVYSKKRKSEMFGAQYLHAPIPGLTGEAFEWVDYQLTGTIEDYREKVYGVNPIQTSVETLEKRHKAWDIRAAYNVAWERYAGLISEQNVTPSFLNVVDWRAITDMEPLSLDTRNLDLIVNSIPLQSLCYQPDSHQFFSASVWAIGDAPERGSYAPFRPSPFTVMCDGTDDHGWYRASNVFGYATVEWPAKRKPPLPGVAEVVKPLYTDCNCYRSKRMGYQFKPVGRYGQWAKGVLSHHAYAQAAAL